MHVQNNAYSCYCFLDPKVATISTNSLHEPLNIWHGTEILRLFSNPRSDLTSNPYLHLGMGLQSPSLTSKRVSEDTEKDRFPSSTEIHLQIRKAKSP